MKYDRDEVKRLERELEIDGDNRFRPYRIGEEAPKPVPDLQQEAHEKLLGAIERCLQCDSTYGLCKACKAALADARTSYFAAHLRGK